jgi:hypothetical protein
MQALISPDQNNLVAQVEPDNNTFPVCDPFYWVECPDYVIASWYYQDNIFVPPPVYIPTAEENKSTAISLLQQTDWTSISDVGNPELANPYLINQAEFIAWRSQVRDIAVNPISGSDVFPDQPQEQWSS